MPKHASNVLFHPAAHFQYSHSFNRTFQTTWAMCLTHIERNGSNIKRYEMVYRTATTVICTNGNNNGKSL